MPDNLNDHNTSHQTEFVTLPNEAGQMARADSSRPLPEPVLLQFTAARQIADSELLRSVNVEPGHAVREQIYGGPQLVPAGAGATTLIYAEQDPSVPWSVLHSTWRVQEQIYAFTKRVIDIAGSLIFCILGLPLFLSIIVCIKATSPGPVMFKHRRLGRGGKEFWCYKFRSMVQDAEQQLQSSEALRAKFEAHYKIKDDPRVTRVGGLLRKTSLDELPQLWNVLRGDMSLIGPRPIVAPELVKYGPHDRKLLSVPPGLSGFWQVCGRSDTSYSKRVVLDMLYIDHRCTWLDLKLMVLTAFAVFRKVGAY